MSTPRIGSICLHLCRRVKFWQLPRAWRKYLKAWIAFPIAQFFSGSRLESIETSTIGISVSKPNISRNGIKTPWSSPGPWNPRPSEPRGSNLVVSLALYPAYTSRIQQTCQREVQTKPLRITVQFVATDRSRPAI